MSKTQENTNKLLNFISQKFENEQLDNSDYARENGMSYNGVKKFRNIKIFFKTKFVIDNG